MLTLRIKLLQLKTKLRSPFSFFLAPNEVAKIRKLDQIFETGTHTLLVRVHTGMKKISTEENLTIPFDPTIPLQRYYPTDKFAHIYKSL